MLRVDPKWRPLNVRVINIWHVLTVYLFIYTFNKYSPRVYYILPVGKQRRLKQKKKKKNSDVTRVLVEMTLSYVVCGERCNKHAGLLQEVVNSMETNRAWGE